MSTSPPLKACPYCKCMVRVSKYENHVKHKCASRSKKLGGISKPAPNNANLSEFLGISIPDNCRQLRHCSVQFDGEDGVLVVSNSGMHLHRFDTLAKAQAWYDALLKHRRLPLKPLGYCYPEQKRFPTSTKVPTRIVARRYSENMEPIHMCEICRKMQAMPGEETCYACKSE